VGEDEEEGALGDAGGEVRVCEWIGIDGWGDDV
jgi:hypothetical protein